MTRTRLALCLALVGVVGACGGRSGLHVSTGDGSVGDGSTGAGQDSRFEGGLGSETRNEGGTPDASAGVGAADARSEGGTPEVRAEAGFDGGRDAPATETGRSEAAVPGDARDAGGDAAPTLSSIEIAPPAPTLAYGTTLPVTITAVYSDGSTKDVSNLATITSSAVAYVTVSGTILTGLHPGTATITATYQGQNATATVTVLDTTLQSISIQTPAPLPIGQTASLVATGVFADGSKQDVTQQATWSSSNSKIASVGSTGTSKGQITGLAAGTATVTATVQTVSGTVQVSVVAKKITSIAITPTQPILQRGVSQAFKATALYDDNSTGDVTPQATWSTGDASVLAVVATGAGAGLATAVAAGQTTITATSNGIVGSTSVTVIAPTLTSITVSPATVTISVGTTTQFKAQGTYSDLSTADLSDSVIWSTGTVAVASVSNAAGTRGLVTALAVGTSNVVASLSGVVATATVTVSLAKLVSITVTPNQLDLPLGFTLPLKATATYGDKTTQDVTASATWTVKDNSIATVGNVGTAAGQVTGNGVGSTTVTATLSEIGGSATVTVANSKLLSIAVAPASATVSAGNAQAFTATGKYDNSTTLDITGQVTWSSSDVAVAQVSNAAGSNGLATSLTSGTATITATLQGVQGTATLTVTAPTLVSITVTPATATIGVGDTQTYNVRGVYANGTTGAITGVTWSMSSTGVATIVAGGGDGGGGRGATATGVGAGSIVISASYTSGGKTYSDSTALTVTAPRSLAGIRLTPANATIRVNGTQAYTVDGDYSDGTTAPIIGGVTLTTSDGAVAAVAGGGRGGLGGALMVTGMGEGTATVTASYTNNGQTFTAKATIIVQAPQQVGLYITPGTASVRVGETQQFSAMATWDDGTSTDVSDTASWTTSDGKLATISNTGGGRGGGGGGGGLATGVSAGTVTINASAGASSAKATLIVTAPVLKMIVVTPANPTIQINLTRNFVATAVYEDGTSATVTSSATWSSSGETVAVMSVAGGGRGGFPGGGVVGGATATALAVGSTTISATYTENGITLTGETLLTVTDPTLLSLEITPTSPTVGLDSQYQLFVATAIYKDYSTRDVTASATWSSSDGSVAIISSSGATAGRATLLGPGTSTITATYGGMSASTVLTAVQRTVESIEVSPANPTAVLGINQRFAATAVYDDGSVETVTADCTWTSSDSSVASVGPTGGTAGVATPIKAGSTTITATFEGVSGSTLLAVSGAKLLSIAVTPSPLSVAVGATQQLKATGTWDDKSTRNITSDVTWISTGDTIATVSNAAGSRGLLTAVSPGSVTVEADVFPVGPQGTLTVTVSAAH